MSRQLSFWDGRDRKEIRLLDAVDEIHHRFGDDSLRRGGKIDRQARE
jgi:hypothetical protein